MKVHVSGFKALFDHEFEIRPLTILTGLNGSGKSSLIQSILLARIWYETFNEFGSVEVPLNDKYGLNLGTPEDVISSGIFSISFDGDELNFSSPGIENAKYLVGGFENYSRSGGHGNNQISDGAIHYLSSERIGPRISNKTKFSRFDFCGHFGEFTGQIIAQRSFWKVPEPKCKLGSKSSYLPLQVNAWLADIIPGSDVSSNFILETTDSQITVKSFGLNQTMKSTNFGVGLSYVLPIIVTCLICENDQTFIVENPEIHLHPSAQSALGYFLGNMANAGVKMIVETHSEHLINGIRRAVVDLNSLKSEEILIHFFSRVDAEEGAIVEQIEIDENGILSYSPDFFFDQVRRDITYLIDKSTDGTASLS